MTDSPDQPDQGELNLQRKDGTDMPTATSRPAPPPPPVPQRGPARTTLHTRIRTDIDAAMRDYRDEHGSSNQAVIEAALIEYLEVRGKWDGGDQQ